MIRLILGVRQEPMHSLIGKDLNEIIDCEYNLIYKPLFKFLHSSKTFKFSLCVTGEQISRYKDAHLEALDIMKEGVSSGQLEIVATGKFNPSYPLLYSRDRLAQMEEHLQTIRDYTGHRPRGASLTYSVWDSTLLPSFSNSGIEYILIPSSALWQYKDVPLTEATKTPYIMSDKQKSISIIPLLDSLKPPIYSDNNSTDTDSNSNINDTNLARVKAYLTQLASLFPTNESHTVALFFSKEELARLLETGFLSSLNLLLYKENFMQNSLTSFVSTILPSSFIKEERRRRQVYLSSYIGEELKQEIKRVKGEDKGNPGYSFYDYLSTFPQTLLLYSRFLYECVLINQTRKLDKAVKQYAKKMLLSAQNIYSFLNYSYIYRQHSYKILSEVEKLTRQSSLFKEQFIRTDYNCDNLNEYVARLNGYYCVLDEQHGRVLDLSYIASPTGNYADYIPLLDYKAVNYKQGLFTDYLLNEENFNAFFTNPLGSAKIKPVSYCEKKFSFTNNKELVLTANLLVNEVQEVYIRKKLVLEESGMMVQYVVRNDSTHEVALKLAVSCLFAYLSETPYNAEAIIKKEGSEDLSSLSSEEGNYIQDVNGVQLVDSANKLNFMLTPNQLCAMQSCVISSKEPVYNGLLLTLYWDLTLKAGGESERLVNFYIYNLHKKRYKRTRK